MRGQEQEHSGQQRDDETGREDGEERVTGANRGVRERDGGDECEHAEDAEEDIETQLAEERPGEQCQEEHADFPVNGCAAEDADQEPDENQFVVRGVLLVAGQQA